jgi:biotin carboxyl carrier protein
MKLRTHLAGLDHEVALDFNDGAAGIVSAEVDGRSYEVEIRELPRGEYLLVVGSRVYRSRVENRGDSPGQFLVALPDHMYDVSVIDPRRLRSGQTDATHDSGTAQIISPMPGKVVRVLVEVGAEVAAGDGIVVVEAMKMQNEMKSPKAGTVISINAADGTTVSAGDVLAVIE